MLDPMPAESTHAYRQRYEKSAAQVRLINEAKLSTAKTQPTITVSKLTYISLLTVLFAVIVGVAVWHAVIV